MINPTIVEGQVRGGVAQGIAAALYEELVYAEDGQLSDRVADGLPRAHRGGDPRRSRSTTSRRRRQFSETGAKGIGEGGTMGAPACVATAVADAVAHLGIEIDRMPDPPRRTCSRRCTRADVEGSTADERRPPDRGHASTATRHEVAVEARRTLADVLRHDLGYTGTHLGCEHGICGACTVLVDGEPTRACLVFGVQADDCEVETVEGLARRRATSAPLQQAFTDHHALQCGFCTPGFLMLATALLRENPRSLRRGDPRGDGLEHLPLHGLLARSSRRVRGRRRRAGGGRGVARMTVVGQSLRRVEDGAPAARRRALRRRRRPPGAAVDARRARDLGARADARRSTRERGARRCPACTPCSPPPTSRPCPRIPVRLGPVRPAARPLPAARARRRPRALRRRAGRRRRGRRRRTSPRTPPSSSSSTSRRCRPCSTPATRSTGRRAGAVRRRQRGRRARARLRRRRRRPSRAPRTSSRSRSRSAATPACRSRRAGSSPSTTPRSTASRSGARRRSRTSTADVLAGLLGLDERPHLLRTSRRRRRLRRARRVLPRGLPRPLPRARAGPARSSGSRTAPSTSSPPTTRASSAAGWRAPSPPTASCSRCATTVWHDNGAYVRTHGVRRPRADADACSPAPTASRPTPASAHVALTNKTPCGTYRGPGRYEATFARERLLDAAADELGHRARRAAPAQPARRPATCPTAARCPCSATTSRSTPATSAGLLDARARAARLRGLGARGARRRASRGGAVGVGRRAASSRRAAAAASSARASTVDDRGARARRGRRRDARPGDRDRARPGRRPTSSASTRARSRSRVGDTDLVSAGGGSWASRSTIFAGGAVALAARGDGRPRPRGGRRAARGRPGRRRASRAVAPWSPARRTAASTLGEVAAACDARAPGGAARSPG